ncbi:MAG TPA: UbiH/UbiF/VisC/COQ6 family ubiquinone biosynthesis hydroxylase [Tahibacter sp.]|uniref:UbiH/UbiF/VisC/COQ6 family ubiquinone biosynthesis hydroxylase n=1 Tax=Tahibacter sp. TaxID=2056211 RepID=UPI002CB4EB85|nr:UbiH/UbiF/VisC/COQ6 family ubiquinone biosynthesis hydroxylase [Tahibacter sp.]HSX62894.1 UbiH/UbiF/VisC/COQ6 family ubiquinone biosynthesis hydroxylase [Tahibacter sp.]
MKPRNVFDVAVVGAGMVGSACALALARQGLRVALVEERAPPVWNIADEVDLRVVALAPSSVALFARLGVWAAIRDARAGAYRRMHVWDSGNGAAIDFDAADGGAAELGFIVENKLIQQTLWHALQNEAGVSLRCPARVVATEDDGAARTLRLDDDGRLVARLVVAADGASSPLRQMLDIGAGGHVYDQHALVAHVRTERPHEDTAWQRFLPGGTLAFLPLADGRCSIVWSLPPHECRRLREIEETAFLQELGCAFDFRLGPVLSTSARAEFPLRLLLAERYIAPRFALIGDAAHQVHPLAGQGVNLGLRDVDALVDAAAGAAGRDPGAVTALRRYERRRRSDNTISAWGMDGINRLFRSEFEPLVFARGLGLRAVNALSPLKQLIVRHAAGR